MNRFKLVCERVASVVIAVRSVIWRPASMSLDTCRAGLCAVLCGGLLLCTGAPVYATAPTLPDIGVDVSAWIGPTALAVGAVVLVAVGYKFAFLVAKRAIRWVSKAVS